MKVFCVLFLVFFNTIGNQGDPIQGLTNFQANKAPSYLVSMRNRSNCHICTGSMISVSWGLTAIECSVAIHIQYDLSEFNICDVIADTEHTRAISKKRNNTATALLFQVQNFDNKHIILRLPTSSCCPKRRSEFGKVIGWSLDNSKSKFVMKTFDGVSLEKAFNDSITSFLRPYKQIGTGSPLIQDGRVIYGFFRNCTLPFYDVLDDAGWITNQMKKK